MKKIFFTLIILLVLIANGQAQDKLKIGEIKNGKFQVTNPDALKAFFINSLGNSGALGKDFQVSTSPEGDRFFVYYPVSGNKDKVTNIGVMLVKIKNDAFIVENPPDPIPNAPGGGGSLEIQCIGVDCNSCLAHVTWVGGNWLPSVTCECLGGGGGICNMTSKLIIHVDI
jgi:hypothetical protein